MERRSEPADRCLLDMKCTGLPIHGRFYKKNGTTGVFSKGHSRSCLPPGSGRDAHMSPAAAVGLLGSCCTDCGQGRCRFRRLGGRAHSLPSLGHRRSQGHSSSHSCPPRGRSPLHTSNTHSGHSCHSWYHTPCIQILPCRSSQDRFYNSGL